MNIKVKIVTPEKTVFEGESYQATLPVSDGEVTILPNHRSYIAALKAGEIVLKDESGKEQEDLAVSGGFIEFDNNNLVILADTAERAEEIDLQAAEVARKKAQELKDSAIEMDENEYARVLATIDREMARIKLARKKFTQSGMKLE